MQTVAQEFKAAMESNDWTLQETLDQFGIKATVHDEVDETYRFYEFPDGSKIGSYIDPIKNPDQVWVVNE